MENLNKKISQLGKLETVTGKEMIPVAINEKNNHVEIDQIKEYANNSLQEKFDNLVGYQEVESMIAAKIAPLETKIEDLSKTNIEPLPADSITATPVNDETKDFVVTGTIGVDKVQISGKSVSLNNVELGNEQRMVLNAVKEVSSTGMKLSGVYTKDNGNSMISIKNSEYVTFKDLVFTPSEAYNGIEIGLSSDNVPKIVTFENCHFAGKFANNPIIVFGTQDNGVINLINCTFDDVSNGLRISNHKNVRCTVNIINCTCKKWDSRDKWAGFVLGEDYTSKTSELEDANNLFAPDKITINFVNFVGPNGKKLVAPEDLATICGTQDQNQTVYICLDSGRPDYIRPYSKEYYPTINIM